ncbi:MAG TPA: hypothetical protein VNN55_07860 [bacterium]|nr:hypothetical protein [bacterium]
MTNPLTVISVIVFSGAMYGLNWVVVMPDDNGGFPGATRPKLAALSETGLCAQSGVK